MQTTGDRIRIQRQLKGYSQECMAYALNISQAAYSNLERNGTKPSLERIYEIADYLEISPFILMPPPRFSIVISYANFFDTFSKIKIYVRSLLNGGVKIRA